METSKHICVLCSRCFGKNSNLERHTKTVHAKQTHTCNICKHTYTRRDNLRAHITKIHQTAVTRPPLGQEKDTIGLLESRPQKHDVPPDPLIDKLCNLDNQMQEVLPREDLHVYDKAKLYQQIVQRYLNQLALYRNKPLGLLDVNPPTSISPQPHSNLTYGIERLVMGTCSDR
jgi:hypothetical protein